MGGKGGTVGVVGLGYVGLTTAACFASKGFETIGVEVDEKKLASIARGRPPFAEKGLAEILSKSLKRRRLVITPNFEALKAADYVFITVGTPSGSDGSIDLSQVMSAATSIGRTIRDSEKRHTVVVKSTVIPGTTADIVGQALESESHRRVGEFGLVANPEFLREGRAVWDTLHAHKLVVGTLDSLSERAILSLYTRFYGRLPPLVKTTPVNAELIKYASNSFLATKVTFVNELANLCEELPGADVKVVTLGMGLDQRIGRAFLGAGLGYGGSCFPKDVKAIIKVAARSGTDLGVIRAAANGNERQWKSAVRLAENLIGNLSGRRIAILGLAFKPESDDVREAVSLRLVLELLERGAAVVAYDPEATQNARLALGDRIEYARSVRDCLRGAECCILCTEWSEFTRIRPSEFKRLMKTPALVDGRRAMDAESFSSEGVKFAAVGLGPPRAKR